MFRRGMEQAGYRNRLSGGGQPRYHMLSENVPEGHVLGACPSSELRGMPEN